MGIHFFLEMKQGGNVAKEVKDSGGITRMKTKCPVIISCYHLDRMLLYPKAAHFGPGENRLPNHSYLDEGIVV